MRAGSNRYEFSNILKFSLELKLSLTFDRDLINSFTLSKKTTKSPNIFEHSSKLSLFYFKRSWAFIDSCDSLNLLNFRRII